MEHLLPRIARVPVRTPTLAPATHTNTWVLGEGELAVFDPASPYEDEQRLLYGMLAERIATGERVTHIVLTHHHHDHVAGAEALRDALGGQVPILAHRATDERVDVRIDGHLDEGDVLEVGGCILDLMHTPGHAPGHLVFRDRDTGAVVAGDMVAGIGTILIEPGDGHLGQYLESLARMQKAGPTALLPAHGPMLEQGEAVLAFYIAHRHQRTEQIRQALVKRGASTPLELAEAVYGGVIEPSAYPIAAVQITSHLQWMREHALAAEDGEHWRAVS
ncbi:MAG: MBL fold metallo-hydrolase [Deltaproteobacteria bacterium]|nr:MAG: MBL fold metallo-hydrolase [Deltaproteobacteria bacterium]